MKFEKIKNQTDEFWKWFSAVASRLAANIENLPLTKELDERVHRLDAGFSWEIGPGKSKLWQFVISPDLNRSLREKARAIVAQAPTLTAWEFHASRQPKEWNYMFELESGDGEELVRLDASNWTFVLLKYPDGAHEVLLRAKDLPILTEDERWQAAAIALESLLGEDVVLDRIQQFELVDTLEPRFAGRERPIQRLREAVRGN